MKTKSDWHQADIIAALHKKNTTLAALSSIRFKFVNPGECALQTLAERRNADRHGVKPQTAGDLAKPLC
jgi:hypothetical protein